MRHPLTQVTGIGLAAGLVLAGVPAAHASTRSFDDARRDAPGSNDIVRTTVTNGCRIGVTVRHRDLTRSASDIQFGLRTSSGAEWHVFAALDGSGGQVYDSDFGAHPCPGLRATRSLAKDRTELSVPRSCVGSPSGRVKFQPRVQWSADGDKGDWSVNGGRHWTPWIGR
ncbi:MAG: hypothetical protein JWN91_505 [Nocardioides sp.]|nr:hypothetical protein [Nocardioides sp.]